jgi:hypothetical protein
LSTVFVVHHGKQKYLKYCIQISEKYGNETYLIGNERSYASKPENFFSDDMEMPMFNEFNQKYVHMSPSPENFEIQCFKRYFQLLYVTENLKKNSFWLIDSDVLLIDNLQKFESQLLKKFFDNAVWTPTQSEYVWLSSAGLSFWTLDSLRSFVNFMIFTYRDNQAKLKEKWFNHLNTKTTGGICDMTLLYLWSAERQTRTYNLDNSYLDYGVIDDNNICIDKNVKIKNNTEQPIFQMVPLANIKKVFFLKNKYYISEKSNSQLYPIRSLHFQGNSKVYMRYYATERTTTTLSLIIPIVIQITKNIRSILRPRSRWQKFFQQR